MLYKLILIILFTGMLAWSAAAAGDDFKQIYAHARHKMQAGEYPAAEIELNKALNAAQLSSEEAAVLFDLSYVYLKMFKTDEAMKCLEQIMDIPDLLMSDHIRAHLQMADVHTAEKKFDEAIDDCKDGLYDVTANTDKYRFLMKAGYIMNTKKDYPAALDYVQQALALCHDNVPNQLTAKRLMVWIYSAQDNYSAVAEVYTRQELDAMPADFKKSVYQTVVNAYMRLARSRQADKDFDKALELYGLIERDKSIKPEQRAEAFMGEASILKAQKKYSEAVKSYNVVLNIQEARTEYKKIARKEIDQLQPLLAKPQPAKNNDDEKSCNTSAGAARSQ